MLCWTDEVLNCWNVETLKIWKSKNVKIKKIEKVEHCNIVKIKIGMENFENQKCENKKLKKLKSWKL